MGTVNNTTNLYIHEPISIHDEEYSSEGLSNDTAADIIYYYKVYNQNTGLRTFVFFYVPILVNIGVITNTIACTVLLVSALKKFSSSHYLAALTVVNNIYLFLLLLTWLPKLGYNIFHRPIICQLLYMVSNVSSFLSLWLAVSFCVDRYIAISWPAEASRMCTVTRSRIVVICLVLVSLIVYLNISITVVVGYVKGRPVCQEIPYLPFRKGLWLMDLIVNHMLPFTAIIILLFLMCRTMYCEQIGSSIWQEDPSQIRPVTVAYSVAFIIAHIPWAVYKSINRINTNFLKNRFNTGSILTFNCRVITEQLSHTAMAMNLPILILCYPLFRQYLFQYLSTFKKCIKGYFKKRSSNDRLPENISLNLNNDEGIIEKENYVK